MAGHLVPLAAFLVQPRPAAPPLDIHVLDPHGEGRADPRDIDLSLAGLVIEKNGALHSTGVGAAVQGSPANAVAWLANTLGALGITLKAGEVILSGAQAPLIEVAHSDVLVATIAGVGTCTARFKGRAQV